MAGNRDSLIAVALAALVFSLYLLTFSGGYHSSDELSMLAATDSLARRGQWDIELLRWMGEQQGSFGPDGHLYSRKGIGMTLAALPAAWLALQSEQVGNVQAAMLTNAIITALTCVLVYLFLRRLHYRIGVALGVALAFALGTMAWPYARYFFSESLAGLGLMQCAYFLLRFRDRQDGASALWAGMGLGVALLSRLNNAIVAPFLGILLLVYVYRHVGRLGRPGDWLKPVALFAIPVAAALAVTGWYNWIRFGNPLITGYLPEERFATPFLEGFYGLILSPGKGLLWYNPLFFAALAAWPIFYRRHRAEALLAAAVVLSNVAFYAPWYLWWAGHSWGPRFLVTILPFAILPLAPAVEAALRPGDSTVRRRLWAVGLGALAVVSVAVQLLGVAVDFNLYLEDAFAELGLYHPDTLFTLAHSPLVRQIGYLRPENLDLAWLRDGVLNGSALFLSLLAVMISALTLWIVLRTRTSQLRAGPLLALIAMVILMAVRVMPLYAPKGDVAQAAQALARVERPGEVAVLTDSLRTEAFQDAYDGRLWVWGTSSPADVRVECAATWVIGPGAPEGAPARFQVGEVRLDFFPENTQVFELNRLPIPLLPSPSQLGPGIELVAALVDDAPDPHRGTLSVTLTWRSVDPVDTAYTVFVHLVDDQGVKAGQVDRPPCLGGCPTDAWRPGDLITERYDLPLTPSASEGSYQIIVGMYDLSTGANLSWFDAQGRDLGPHLSLGVLELPSP